MSEVMHTKKNSSILKQLFTLCAFLFLFQLIPHISFAASYSLSPADGSFENGKSFSVRVMVNAGSDAVNTGDATITYDTTKLTAVSVSKEGSPFNLWVTEPKINGGTITFAGGGTTPISGSKSIVTITFKAKAEGSAKVDFSKATLLAGAGQNVLTGSAGATYTITVASAVAPDSVTPTVPKEERKVNIPPPDAPNIKSSTHSDEKLWYNVSGAKFNWDIPYGVLGMSLGFDQDPNGTSTKVHEPPIGEWVTEDVADGTWYFHAEYKNRGGWGSSTTYKIQVDKTPPDEFTVEAIGGDFTAQLRFEARDSLSGILLYRVAIDGGRARDVQPSELTGGGYLLSNLDPGEYAISVVAVDLAGNERATEAPVVVTGIKAEEKSTEVTTSGFGAIYWVSLFFMAALAILITMLVLERRKSLEQRDHIKRETMEVGDRLINIFGVLRDEIEEKILELSHKPNMTDNERNILEGLKDALDISEELIDKEIEDVRKLLK
jgi:hypothetical protein